MTAVSAPPSRRESVLFRPGLLLGRNAKLVLTAGALVLIIFGVVGAGAFGKLKAGGFEDPGSDSATAAAVSGAHFPADPNLVLVVTPADGRLDSAAPRQPAWPSPGRWPPAWCHGGRLLLADPGARAGRRQR